MNVTKKIIKATLPPVITDLIRNLTKKNVKWHGNYSSWKEASKNSLGYNSTDIVKKVLNSTLEVKNGNATYERDSVLFHDEVLNHELLTALLYAKNNKTDLEIVDFGGALGSLYFQHRNFLQPFGCRWTVIEQDSFYEVGTKYIEDENLKFQKTLEGTSHESFLILSGVLQYLSDPYEFLNEILEKKFSYIFIDRTGMNTEDVDRLTVQEVPPSIYQASYPCWFFSESKILEKFKANYILKYEFRALDHANIPSVYKGYFFERRS
jgi:putative methyltransferase (TIGR04325 family)